MSKSIVITAIVAGLVGFVAGNAFWYLASPLWIDNVVQERLPGEASAASIAKGRFRDADSLHKGSGIAAILRTSDGSQVLRFTEFKSTNGPDLKVYLVKAGEIRKSSDVTSSKWISLGRLKGNIGDQNYFLPADLNARSYGSVAIWCEKFGVLFSSARLAPTN